MKIVKEEITNTPRDGHSPLKPDKKFISKKRLKNINTAMKQ